ncbi:MAG: hypothetical protein CL687_05150 [Candidatus Pelagibacter sp.]|nr:hypothetical protein [Candidatus Pelagibacter sp.]OUV96083.1 MAG: hypothetical protein CBD02_05410 [Candidatus Pelagibacter sp. TMED142]OUV98652.1 MAG: hypothetical protein CBD02_00710 [Candidatus Pelagibacter sp. TMED142]
MKETTDENSETFLTIRKLPDLPPEIKTAIKENKLAIFVGAGVSRILGCDSWEQLANNLVEVCFSVNNGDSRLINFKTKERLQNIRDSKELVTICHQLLKQSGNESLFEKQMKKSLCFKQEIPEQKNIYKSLSKINALFLTTNADTLIDSAFPQRGIIYKEADFSMETLDRNKLYHLHGSIKDTETLVFTASQYIQRYNDLTFTSFLKTIFEKYHVLFIGYGLSEFEVLDFLLKKSEPYTGKHFTLEPFFKGEEQFRNLRALYYKDLNIQMIDYSIDENGYKQLHDVIKFWVDQQYSLTEYLPTAASQIDDAIHFFSTEKVDSTLRIIKSNLELERYFIGELCKSEKALNWLEYLDQEGSFSPEKYPKPIKDNNDKFSVPFWPYLKLLFHISKEIHTLKPENKLYTYKKVNSILNSIVELQMKNRKKEITSLSQNSEFQNPNVDSVIMEIWTELPIEYFTFNSIEFISSAFDTAFSTILVESMIAKKIFPFLIKHKSKDLVLALLKVILQPKYERNHSDDDELEGLLEEYDLNETLSKNSDNIISLCKIEVAKIVIGIINKILKKDSVQFNIVSIPTIEEHEQKTSPDKYQSQLVTLLTKTLELEPSKKVREIVKQLLVSKYEILRRIVFHIINYHYKEFKDIFWNLEKSPLETTYIHEIYELLKKNCQNFSAGELETITTWIEEIGARDELKDLDSNSEKNAYYKKEWFGALLRCENLKVKELHQKYNSINDTPIKHPGFHRWLYGAGILKEKNPIEKHEFLKKSNLEKIEFINNYTPNNEVNYDDFIRETLSIDEFVASSPERFIREGLTPFLKINIKYQIDLLRGLKYAHQNNKWLDWGEILDFIVKLISGNRFWQKELNADSVQEIASLLETGLNSEKKSISNEYLPMVEMILVSIFEEFKEEKFEQSAYKDPSLFILNTGIGRLLIASLELSLRKSKERKNKTWGTIKQIFDNRLKSNSQRTSTSIIILEFFQDFHFLDSEWLEIKLKDILKSSWELAMKTLLSNGGVLYKFLYDILKNGGHYASAINYNFESWSQKEHFISHLLLGYDADFEEFSDADSLLIQLIREGNTESISIIIKTVTRLSEHSNFKIEKVKLLWKKLIELEKSSSDLISWINLFPEIDADLLDLVVSSISNNDNTGIIYDIKLPTLKTSAQKSPVITSEFLYVITKNIGYWDWEKKDGDLYQILETLYKKKQTDKANLICNLYLQAGYHFLRPLYEKYNQPQS